MTDLITRGLRLHIVGVGGENLLNALGLSASPLEESDVAIFIVSAQSGIIRADSDQWQIARELYIPCLVVITDLSAENETDFEDMVAIAGRILDPVITPYLVLHKDDGSPIALIDLENESIVDYSTGKIEIRESDPEHREVIADFRAEYLEELEFSGRDAFENGLAFPALPWIPSLGIGLAQIHEHLNRIPVGS